MKSRLLAYFALLAAYAVVASATGLRVSVAGSVRADIPLLPAAIGERHPDQHWRNTQSGDRIEEGALYAAPGKIPLQLDFYRDSLGPHNGIQCYLMQGEKLRRLQTRSLPLKTGQASFQVALLRNADSLRLVAASECMPSHCAETVPLQSYAGGRVLLADTDVELPSVVPVSLSLEAPTTAEGEVALSRRLDKELMEAVRQLDLAPARLQAGLQAATN